MNKDLIQRLRVESAPPGMGDCTDQIMREAADALERYEKESDPNFPREGEWMTRKADLFTLLFALIYSIAINGLVIMAGWNMFLPLPNIGFVEGAGLMTTFLCLKSAQNISDVSLTYAKISERIVRITAIAVILVAIMSVLYVFV